MNARASHSLVVLCVGFGAVCLVSGCTQTNLGRVAFSAEACTQTSFGERDN